MSARARRSDLAGRTQGNRLGVGPTVPLILVGSQVTSAGVAFVVNLLGARAMAPSDRGLLALALQLAYLLTVPAVMGLERPFMAMASGEFSAQFRAFARLVRPGVAGVVLVGVISLPIFHLVSVELWIPVALVVAYGAMNAVFRGFRVAYVASHDWRMYGVCVAALQVPIVVGSVWLTLRGDGSFHSWLTVYVVAGVAPIAAVAIAARGRPRSARLGAAEV